jgi:signal transduction histidine kinase
MRNGFIGVGVAGTILLSLFVAVDFNMFSPDERVRLGTGGILHELADHVAFPLFLLLFPMSIAILTIVKRSLAPLQAAAERIDASVGKERGFRLQTDGAPPETLVFIAAVNSLLERLDDAAMRQESFAADVAHELKTPLAVITLELERMSAPGAEQIKEDLKAVNRLIEQLLTMAQLDAYAAAPQPFQRIDLAEAAKSVIGMMAPAAIAQGVPLILEDLGDAVVEGRAETLGAAIRNLIENAIRVTPAGKAVVIITGPGPQVRVRDGGPGVSEEMLKNMRIRLNRADHASVGGAGLGLAIVSRIVEVHGGDIVTRPEQSEFQLTFPRPDLL